MRCRLLTAVLLACLAARAQSLSIRELRSFIQSSIQLKQTDKQVAGFLSRVRLTEKLDDGAVEQMQSLGIGPRTLAALRLLRDQSQGLAAAALATPEAPAATIPPPSAEEQAAVIAEIREYALRYTKNLPDFICTQVTRRYVAPTPGGRSDPHGTGGDSSWQLQDTLTIRLSYFEQKEDYKLVLVNNTATQQDYRKMAGSVSTGEFGSMLREIFEPATEAHFEWDHWATLRSRRALTFKYEVAKARSQWVLDYQRQQQFVPAYSGLVYVDREMHQVLRVSMVSRDVPADFPIRQAETVLDYDYQTLSDRRFLLPLKADSRIGTSDTLSRLDEEFRLYRKFSTESEIKYDTPEPLPANQTQEQAPQAPR